MSLFWSVLCRLVLCLQLSVLRFVRRSPRGAWCDTFDTTEKQPNCQHGAPKYGAVKVTRFEMYKRLNFKCTRGARWRGKGGFAEQTAPFACVQVNPRRPSEVQAVGHDRVRAIGPERVRADCQGH